MAKIQAKATGNFLTANFRMRSVNSGSYKKYSMSLQGNTWSTDVVELPVGSYDYKYLLSTGPGADYDTEIVGSTPLAKETGTVPSNGWVTGGFTIV
jgi:hypothetical protein